MKCPHCEGTGELKFIGATVGALIREYRSALGWKQSDLAERAGVDSTHVSLIETGKHGVHLSTLQRFAEAFGCSMKELVP